MDSSDIVAVGDITTDAFIKIKDANLNCDINHDHCLLCVRFGDKIPYESVTIVRAVGNAPNAAVSARRLELDSAIVTDIGEDQNGQECLDSLKHDDVDTTFVRIHAGEATNYHYVWWYEAERTIFIKHQAYQYVFPDIGSPKWLYLSSLAENSLPYHTEIAHYLKEHPDIKLAFQPGTFQMKLGYEKLKEFYERAELFFCNTLEAQRILEKERESDIKVLLHELRERGPKIAVITDGPGGAYAFDGSEMWYIPMYPDPKPPLERTGAGDAFSSTVTSALALGKSLPEALSWGPINSMSVVQYVGAQKGLLTREALEKYLREAPESYWPQKIT